MITLSNNKINSESKKKINKNLNNIKLKKTKPIQNTINKQKNATTKKEIKEETKIKNEQIRINEIKTDIKNKDVSSKNNKSAISTKKKNTTIKVDNKLKNVSKKINTTTNKQKNIETKEEIDKSKNAKTKIESSLEITKTKTDGNTKSIDKKIAEQQKNSKIKVDAELKNEKDKLNDKPKKDLLIQQSFLNFKNTVLKKTINIIIFIIKIIFLISFILSLTILIKTDILPFKYLFSFILISSVVLIFAVLTEFILKGKILKIVSTIVSLLFVLIYILIYIYLAKTDSFINSLFNNHQIEKYYLAVLSDSEYENINDLNELKIGTYYNNEESYNEIVKKMNETIKYEEIKYNNLFELCNHLINGEVDAILISGAYKEIIEESNELISVQLKYVYDISAKIKVNINSKDLNVVRNPFIVYITGIDTYDDISNVSRSDVNIIVTVNPKTKEILLVTIPRDYYIQLHGTTGIRDKLTHAGLYGVDMSVSTIEDLLDIDINYYIRLNFSTLINAIDTIGGVDVYSEIDFNTYGYKFYKGYNHVNGEKALAFSRERKSIGGDRVRGQNQMRVIEAIINKISTSRVLVNNYLNILESLDGTFQTNLEANRIYDLVKMQLASMPKWKIYTYSLDGYDSQNYTYSMNTMTFVMEPDYNTVYEAKEKIKALLEKK